MQCRKPAARALSGGEAHWQGMLSRAAHAERKSAGYVTGFHGNRGTDPANYHRHQDTGDPGPPRPASVGHRVRYRPVLRQQSFLSEATYRHRSADGGHRWDLSRRTLLVVGGAFAV